MSERDDYETMTHDDLIECLNFWEQLAFQKTNEVKRLQEEIKRLQDAISQCGFGDLEHSCQDNLPEEIVDRLNLPYY